MAGGLRLKWVEPVRIPVLSQPGHLSFGELAGGRDSVLNGFVEGALAVEMGPELPVAYGAHVGILGCEIAPSA